MRAAATATASTTCSGRAVLVAASSIRGSSCGHLIVCTSPTPRALTLVASVSIVFRLLLILIWVLQAIGGALSRSWVEKHCAKVGLIGACGCAGSNEQQFGRCVSPLPPALSMQIDNHSYQGIPVTELVYGILFDTQRPRRTQLVSACGGEEGGEEVSVAEGALRQSLQPQGIQIA